MRNARETIEHWQTGHSRNALAVLGTALALAASLVIAAHTMSGWAYLAINASVIVAALLLGAVGWFESRRHASHWKLDVAGIAAFVGFAGLLVYEWDHLFTLT